MSWCFHTGTASEAYLEMLESVHDLGDLVQPRGLATKELQNFVATVRIPNSAPIVTRSIARNAVVAKYTREEMELYRAGVRDAKTWGEVSKFWHGLANPDGNVNSAYGWLLNYNRSAHGTFGGVRAGDRLTQWDWALGSLLRDIDTRQAFMHFNLPAHQWLGNKDQVCTMHGQFLARENRLHFTVVMRSNDLVRGTVYDMPYFISLQEKMLRELKEHYAGLTMGQYTHMVHSLHYYTKDEEVVELMLDGDEAHPAVAAKQVPRPEGERTTA